MIDGKQIKPGTITGAQVATGTITKTQLGAGGILTSDKNLTPQNANNSNTGLTISNAPLSPGFVQVAVNGINAEVGNGVTNLACYFATVTHPFGSGAAVNSSDGTLYAWGFNTKGIVGDNTTANRSSPTSVVGGHSFTVINANTTTPLGIKADRTIWAWGDNALGQIGDNTITVRSSPVSVVGGHSFIAVCGNDNTTNGFSAALKSDGSLWTWGDNTFGQLGDNTNTARSSPVSVVGGHSFSKISVGAAAVGMALKSDGTCWTWGSNPLGDNTISNRSSPVSVIGGHSFIAIACGSSQLALKSDGTAWAWGPSGFGTIGDNTGNNRSSPVSVVGGHSFIALSAVFVSSIGLKSDGTAWAWGNGNGSVGDNTNIQRSSPVSVVGGHSFIAIYGFFAVKSDNSLWSWGYSNTSGALGDNTTTNRSSPVSIVGITNGIITPLSFGSIVAGSNLLWNSTSAGFALNTTDRVDFNYS